MALHLTPEQKAGMVKMLLDKSAYDVGLEYGLDKYYKNSATVIATVSKIYNQVKNNPETYAMSTDLLSAVEEKVRGRTSRKMTEVVRRSLREQADEKKFMKIEDIALDNRAKAAAILSIKLDDLLYSKKDRKKVSVGELAKVYGITFDKGQLIEGKATDHVSLMAKINTEDMSPQDAIDAVMKMREYNQSVMEKSDKK
jgi:hypothetical protein